MTAPPPLDFTFTDEDFALAAAEAARRTHFAIRNRIPPKWGAPTGWKGEAIHLRSMRGEVAVARVLGMDLTAPAGTIDRVDVGGQVEVRSTHWPQGYLNLFPDSDPRSPFVLVVVPPDSITVSIKGWITGAYGMTPHHRVPNPRNAREHQFHIFQHQLEDIRELPGWLRDRRKTP